MQQKAFISYLHLCGLAGIRPTPLDYIQAMSSCLIYSSVTNGLPGIWIHVVAEALESKLLLSLVNCSSCTGVHHPPPLSPVTDSCVPFMGQFTNSWHSQSRQKGRCPPNMGNLCSSHGVLLLIREGHRYCTFLHCCMSLLLWPKWPPRYWNDWNIIPFLIILFFSFGNQIFTSRTLKSSYIHSSKKIRKSLLMPKGRSRSEKIW